MQKDMSYFMLATFADAFRDQPAPPTEMQRSARGPLGHDAQYQGVDLGDDGARGDGAVLADTVLKEFKMRLGRIGIEYQTPVRP